VQAGLVRFQGGPKLNSLVRPARRGTEVWTIAREQTIDDLLSEVLASAESIASDHDTNVHIIADRSAVRQVSAAARDGVAATDLGSLYFMRGTRDCTLK
jgi:hypothetical protein